MCIISTNIWKPVINFWYTFAHITKLHIKTKSKATHIHSTKIPVALERNKTKSSYDGDIIHPLLFPSTEMPKTNTVYQCTPANVRWTCSWNTDKESFQVYSIWKIGPLIFGCRKRTVLTWNNFNYGFITFVSWIEGDLNMRTHCCF